MNSTNMDRLPLVEQQAVQWFNLLQSGEPAEDELVKYIDWLSQSPAHEQAMARVESTWEAMDGLSVDGDISKALDQYTGVQKRHSSGKRWFLAYAAMLVIAVSSFFYLSEPGHQPTGNLYRTALGDQRVIAMQDGSQITLNTNTEIVVTFSDSERMIHLRRGEALFNVSEDPDRPFIVTTDFGSTIALGTEFNVRNYVDSTVVSLLEGKVLVTVEESVSNYTGVKTSQLAPGEKISYNNKGELSAIEKVDVSQVLLWTEQKLNFDDQTLSHVVAEINRYTPKKLVIVDPEILDIRINMLIRVSNIDSFLVAIEQYFDVKAEHHFGRTELYRKKAGTKS